MAPKSYSALKMYVSALRRKWAYLAVALLLGVWCFWPEPTTVSVTVQGAVMHPGRIVLPASANLEDALAAAGGWRQPSDLARFPGVIILQKHPMDQPKDFFHIGVVAERGGGRTDVRLKYDDEKRKRVKDGWVIRVPTPGF